jgi:hypothetical protein
MKSLIALGFLAISVAAPALADDTVTLQPEAAGAARALLAVPREAAQYNDGVEIRDITVIQVSRLETRYLFSGRRRGIGSNAPRQLLITEKRTILGGFTIEYEAILIP